MTTIVMGVGPIEAGDRAGHIKGGTSDALEVVLEVPAAFETPSQNRVMTAA